MSITEIEQLKLELASIFERSRPALSVLRNKSGDVGPASYLVTVDFIRMQGSLLALERIMNGYDDPNTASINGGNSHNS
jgi:hypothetical protein